MFDDGSRIITTTSPSSTEKSPPSSIQSSRGNVSLEVYYEVDRVAKEVVEKLDWSENTVRGQLMQQHKSNGEDTDTSKTTINNKSSSNIEDDGFLCRIALQFPDELLADAPDVSWLMEDAISNAYRDKLLLLQSQSILQNTNISQEIEGDSLAQHQSSSQQQELINKHLQQPPLLFILGDTTYGSCCPDEISANHLNANVIVHYGYGCLSPTEVLPVVYAFGVCNIGDSNDGGENKVWKECVQMVLSATNEANDETQDDKKRKLLILYEVKYHHAINELKLQFDEKISSNNQKFQEIILGKIPKQQLNSESSRQLDAIKKMGGGCCGGEEKANDNGCCNSTDQNAACCNSPTVERANEASVQPTTSCCDTKDTPCCNQADQDNDTKQAAEIEPKNTTIVEQQQYIPRTIGGLEIPNDLDLTEFTLLYIGDDLNIDSSEKNVHTRLLHILLRCSAPDGPQAIWSYSPIHRQLNTDVLNSPVSPTNDTSLSTIISRTLRRRYFLLNKTKLANTIAILIGTTSNSYSFRRLLARTRHRIQSSGRTAYTFAVGKLSTAPNKLANFAEIDAFVLIACGESIASFWQMEREEMLVPVLTPLELDVALGYREWDGRYSCDFGDLIRWDEEDGIVDESLLQDGVQQLDKIDHHKDLDNTVSDSDCDDEPFFSMISGKYEQSRSSAKQKNDLESLPGQGKLIEYKSEAAEFLKQREYRGLEANVGETEVKAAVKGLVGIASNYGEKLSKDT